MNKTFPFGESIPEELTPYVRIKQYPRGTTIFTADHEADHFYYIQKGRIQVFYLMENSWIHTIRFYKQGDMMGDLEFFHQGKHRCYSQTMTDVTCLEISLVKLREYMNHHPELLWDMGRSIAEKLQKTGMIQAARMRYPLKTRLASYFMMLDQLPEGDTVYQELHADSLIELSALIGCSYRHLNRTLKEMETEGLLSRNNGKLTLLDRKKLSVLAAEME